MTVGSDPTAADNCGTKPPDSYEQVRSNRGDGWNDREGEKRAVRSHRRKREDDINYLKVTTIVWLAVTLVKLAVYDMGLEPRSDGVAPSIFTSSIHLLAVIKSEQLSP